MTVDTKNISNEQAIVKLIDPSVFADRPSSRFALGFLAHGLPQDIEESRLFREYLRFRANVYIDQAALLGETCRDSDGIETDSDDYRSSHIVTIENRLSHVAVVASMRVIQKTDEWSARLPYENEFDREVPVGATEISRYINRIDDRREAANARAALFVAALALINAKDMSPTVAVVEPELERRLIGVGVPLVRSAQPKMLEKYGDVNVGIEIDTVAFAKKFGGVTDQFDTTAGIFVYWGQVESDG